MNTPNPKETSVTAPTNIKTQLGRFLRLFLAAFIPALALSAMSLHGTVDAKVLGSALTGAAVGAVEVAWRQFRPAMPVGSLADVITQAIAGAQATIDAGNAQMASIHQAMSPLVKSSIDQAIAQLGNAAAVTVSSTVPVDATVANVPGTVITVTQPETPPTQ